ncbi:MAG: DUF115 domain-containing protein [Lachnospiraceae bacterium]|nr:DUF115 domain-containing protein [Lachnospiraceae bacterium]
MDEQRNIMEENMIFGTEQIAGRKVLYAIKEGKQYQLDSLYDSDYMVENWFSYVEAHGLRYRSKVFLFGIGNGMYLSKLLSATEADVQIFLYEPSEELYEYVIEQFSLDALLENERVKIVVGQNECLSEKIDKYLAYEDIKGLIFSKYPNYSRIYPKELKKYAEEIQLTINRREAEGRLLERHGKAYYNNTFSNLKYLYQGKSMRDLWNHMPKKIPAFIVSSGPSLDKNVEELKKIQGRGLIIAADSAVRALLAHNIIPDLFVSVDGMKSLKHFEDDRIQQIPLLCDLQSNAAMMQRHEGLKFFVKSLDFHIQNKVEALGAEIPNLSTGGSVAHECFELARILECNPIILVGQDLAYTGNHTHSTDTIRGARNIDASTLDTVVMEGIDGQPILSSYEFQLYLQWFEQQIQKHPETKVIDATEGGAKIHGCEIRTLSDAIKEIENPAYDFHSIIENAGNMMDEEQRVGLEKFIVEIPAELKTALQLARQINRDYEKMISLIYQSKYHNNEFQKLYRKVSENTLKLDAMGVMEYVQNHIQKETSNMLEKVYDVQKDEKAELISACSLGRDYITIVIGAIEKVLPDITQRIGLESSSQ